MSELDRCRRWIEAALEHNGGTHLFEDVVEALQEGRMQLWPAPSGCLVTEIQVYPRKRVLNVFLAGGTLDQLDDMTADVSRWAQAQGCDFATMYGRPGWARVLDKRGWTHLFTVMRKELG